MRLSRPMGQFVEQSSRLQVSTVLWALGSFGAPPVGGLLKVQSQRFPYFVIGHFVPSRQVDWIKAVPTSRAWPTQSQRIDRPFQPLLRRGIASARGSPTGETCRYSVDRVMPNSRHRAPTFVSGLPIAAIASRSLAGVIFGLRPPLRPRARAEASPARVRSEIRSRSNSASDAKMPKTSLPAGVVVSIAAP